MINTTSTTTTTTTTNGNNDNKHDNKHDNNTDNKDNTYNDNVHTNNSCGRAGSAAALHSCAGERVRRPGRVPPRDQPGK